MRSAIVVLPVCASVAAGVLLGVQLRARPAPSPTVIVAPLPVVARGPVRAASADARPEPPARLVAGQYLESNLLLAYPDMPPALLEPHTGPDAFRYGWRYEALAMAMARELTAVIDHACPHGAANPQCADIPAPRVALASFTDEGDVTETHALRRWATDDDASPTYKRQLTIAARNGSVALDVVCTSASDYLGMRDWNDAVTCDATLRDHGRLLATYLPRELQTLDRGVWLVPRGEWRQTVTFAHSELVLRTGGASSDDELTWSAR